MPPLVSHVRARRRLTRFTLRLSLASLPKRAPFAILLLFVLASVLGAPSFASAQVAPPPPRPSGHTEFFHVRPAALVLPTGCQSGQGPQYRSFDPVFGHATDISGRTFIEFDVIHICSAAGEVCTSRLSGAACCQNACLQHHSGRIVSKVTVKNGVARFPDGKLDPTGVGAVFDPEGYRDCAKRCQNVPDVPDSLVRDAPTDVRIRVLKAR